MKLVVKDILNRPHFQHAEVIVGKKGLNRLIKWVHVVEIDTFGHLLNGQELILTTGIGWINDETKSIHYLQQLIDHNTSALAIELQPNNNLSKKMLALAEEHDFPIILFNKEVKFVDITKDIHQLLLGYQENVWHKLENLNEKLNQILVSNGTISDFLKALYHGTNKQVGLIHTNQQTWFFPSNTKKAQKQHIKKINHEPTAYYSMPIFLLKDEIATLYLLDDQANITSFDQFAVKRCGELLTQYFWKYYQQEEVEKIKENEWVLEGLEGALDKEVMIKNISYQDASIKIKEAIIGVIPTTDNPLCKTNDEVSLTGTFMSIRTIFENEGFYLFNAEDTKHHCYTLFLLNQGEGSSIYSRLNNALAKLKSLNKDRNTSKHLQWISFGKLVTDYKQLPNGYQTALSTLNYQKTREVLAEPFYHHLAIFRIIEQFKDMNELNDIVQDYIGPLITYDNEKGTELVKTLQVYLKNLGAKNETARELFIVRQTLYHRLDRIKELIGSDYKEPKKRLMIEFALYTLEFKD